MAAFGTAAACLPTQISQFTSGSASRAANWAMPRCSGAAAAATTPSTVAGATTGPATRFAITVTRLICPDKPAISGAVASAAATGVTTALASSAGTPLARSRADHAGASSTSAAVASTDRANPGATPSCGSCSTSTTTAVANAGSADRSRPSARASSPTAPITAARSTLGSGPASTTNPASASSARAADRRGPQRSSLSNSSTAPQMIARFAPLTAVRCASPATRNSSVTCGGTPVVSPTVNAGSSPAGSGARTAQARRSPARSDSAARCQAGAGATC